MGPYPPLRRLTRALGVDSTGKRNHRSQVPQINSQAAKDGPIGPSGGSGHPNDRPVAQRSPQASVGAMRLLPRAPRDAEEFPPNPPTITFNPQEPDFPRGCWQEPERGRGSQGCGSAPQLAPRPRRSSLHLMGPAALGPLLHPQSRPSRTLCPSSTAKAPSHQSLERVSVFRDPRNCPGPPGSPGIVLPLCQVTPGPGIRARTTPRGSTRGVLI